MHSILHTHTLTPYGHYALSGIESSCSVSGNLLQLPPGPCKELAYQHLCSRPSGIEVVALEQRTKDKHTQRYLLCSEPGIYIGKYHTHGPELLVRNHGVFYTDSHLRGCLYIPPNGCIPEIKNGWRAVYALAGTIIQLTDRALHETT